MDLSSSTLKQRAGQKLQQTYGQAILATLIFSMLTTAVSSGGTIANLLQTIPQFIFEEDSDVSALIGIGFSPFIFLGGAAALILTGPLEIGLTTFFLNLANRKEAKIELLFSQFKNLGNVIIFTLLRNLFIFLWSLLFIIPGFIAELSYAMAPYILAEHPEISATDALKLSKQMMDGNKGDLFVLYLSFFGWYLLGIVTFGIGFIFVLPRIRAAETEFFNEVSGNNITNAQNTFGQSGFTQQYSYTQQNNYAQQNGYAQPPFNVPNGDRRAPESFSSPFSGENQTPDETDRF